MKSRLAAGRRVAWLGVSFLCCATLTACGAASIPTSEAASPAANPATNEAPPASATGGFDGQRAFQYVADLVAIGPRSAGTDGSHRAQQYIIGKLKSFGCPVDEEDFTSPTPIGTVTMKNIVAKVPGTKPDIVMFATHYDTKRMDNFVGANDGGSSTGLMLELASLVCKRKNALTVWITFFDGEEAFNPDWKDPDNTYGSRELAARMALSGDLPRLKAMILADMIGGQDLRLPRETDSTAWLTDLVWSTAQRLGYRSVFANDSVEIDDDHDAFLRRKVAATDIIDLVNPQRENFWHTLSDTLDKVKPANLAMVGHVLITVLPELEQRFAGK